MPKTLLNTQNPTNEQWKDAVSLILLSYQFCYGGPDVDLVSEQEKFLKEHTDFFNPEVLE